MLQKLPAIIYTYLATPYFEEACKLVKMGNRDTLTSRDIQSAVKL